MVIVVLKYMTSSSIITILSSGPRPLGSHTSLISRRSIWLWVMKDMDIHMEWLTYSNSPGQYKNFKKIMTALSPLVVEKWQLIVWLPRPLGSWSTYTSVKHMVVCHHEQGHTQQIAYIFQLSWHRGWCQHLICRCSISSCWETPTMGVVDPGS